MRRGALGVLLLVTAAGLVGSTAVAPSADAAGRTIHGRIDDRGRAVPGVEVGYFEPRTELHATVRTDAGGRFSLRVPAAATAGYVWAGRRPSGHVTFSAHGTAYVTAVVGGAAPGRVPSALFQTRRPASPDAIGGGGDLAIHLRRAARLTGRDASLQRARIVLRRGDGSLVRSVLADARGAYRLAPLAPGRYRVAIRPSGSSLASAAGTVRLRSGASTALRQGIGAAVRRREGVLAGHVSAPATVASIAARIEVMRAGRILTAVRATATGAYRIRGLAPGRYTLVAGHSTPQPYADPPRAHPTPDDTAVVTRTVVVRAARTTRADLGLVAAGSVGGTAPGLDEVVVEDASGTVVRVATVAPAGGFRAGGLPTGRYTVLATDSTGFGSRTVDVRAGRRTAVGRIDRTAALPTVSGTVAVPQRSTGESVVVAADLVGPTGAYDVRPVLSGANAGIPPDGVLRIEHVVPGLHRFVVQTTRGLGAPADLRTHADSVPVQVRVPDDGTTVHLVAGPLRGHLEGDFRTSVAYGAGFLPFEVVAADGHREGVLGNGQDADFQIDAPPGTYRWERSLDVVVADDGPWWGRPVRPTLAVPARWRTDASVRIAIEH